MYKPKSKKSKPNKSEQKHPTSKKLSEKTINGNSIEASNPRFSVGKVVKLFGLLNKPELNGRSGVILKKLDDDRFRITIGEENDLALKESNLKLVEQCPYKNRLNITGILIWPHIKGVCEPSMQWMDDDKLTRSFVNLFDNVCKSQQSFKVQEGSYVKRLKKLLKWKTPMIWLHTNGSADDNKLCVYWDADSKAPLNDSMKIRLPAADIQGCIG